MSECRQCNVFPIEIECPDCAGLGTDDLTDEVDVLCARCNGTGIAFICKCDPEWRDYS